MICIRYKRIYLYIYIYTLSIYMYILLNIRYAPQIPWFIITFPPENASL